MLEDFVFTKGCYKDSNFDAADIQASLLPYLLLPEFIGSLLVRALKHEASVDLCTGLTLL